MDWKEIGFNSEEEMQASIERAKQAKTNPTGEIKQGFENLNRLHENMDERGRLDLNAISEGARLNELDKEVVRRMYWEEQDRIAQKKADAFNELLRKTSEATRAENEAKAARQIKEEKDKALKAIEDKFNKENNIFKDPLDEAFKNLLGGM